MSSIIFFLIFIPILSIVLLSVNFIFAPHNPYKEKKTPFECGYHSFLSQNRTQFTISFFIFALLFLIFDLEIVLIYPYTVSSYANNIYGLVTMIVFTLVVTVGFVFELGKNALKIESKQSQYVDSNVVTSNNYEVLKPLKCSIIGPQGFIKLLKKLFSLVKPILNLFLENSFLKFATSLDAKSKIRLFLFIIISSFLLVPYYYLDYFSICLLLAITNLFFISIMVTNSIYNRKKISPLLVFQKLAFVISNLSIVSKYIKDNIYSILFNLIIGLLLIFAVSIVYGYFTEFDFQSCFFSHINRTLCIFGLTTILFSLLFSKEKYKLSSGLDNLTFTRFVSLLLSYTVFVYTGLNLIVLNYILALFSDAFFNIITFSFGIMRSHSLSNNLFKLISSHPIRKGNFVAINSPTASIQKVDYSFLIQKSNFIRNLLFDKLVYKIVNKSNNTGLVGLVNTPFYLSDVIHEAKILDFMTKGKLSLTNYSWEASNFRKTQVITFQEKVIVKLPLNKNRFVFISTDKKLIQNINNLFFENKLTNYTSIVKSKLSGNPSNKLLLTKNANHDNYSDFIYNKKDNILNNLTTVNKPLPLDLKGLTLCKENNDIFTFKNYVENFYQPIFMPEPVIVMPLLVSQFRILNVVQATKAITDMASVIAAEDRTFLTDRVTEISKCSSSIICYVQNRKLDLTIEDDKLTIYPDSIESRQFLKNKKDEIYVSLNTLLEKCIYIYIDTKIPKIRILLAWASQQLVTNTKLITNDEFLRNYDRAIYKYIYIIPNFLLDNQAELNFLSDYTHDIQERYDWGPVPLHDSNQLGATSSRQIAKKASRIRSYLGDIQEDTAEKITLNPNVNLDMPISVALNFSFDVTLSSGSYKYSTFLEETILNKERKECINLYEAFNLFRQNVERLNRRWDDLNYCSHVLKLSENSTTITETFLSVLKSNPANLESLAIEKHSSANNIFVTRRLLNTLIIELNKINSYLDRMINIPINLYDNARFVEMRLLQEAFIGFTHSKNSNMSTVIKDRRVLNILLSLCEENNIRKKATDFINNDMLTIIKNRIDFLKNEFRLNE